MPIPDVPQSSSLEAFLLQYIAQNIGGGGGGGAVTIVGDDVGLNLEATQLNIKQILTNLLLISGNYDEIGVSIGNLLYAIRESNQNIYNALFDSAGLNVFKNDENLGLLNIINSTLNDILIKETSIASINRGFILNTQTVPSGIGAVTINFTESATPVVYSNIALNLAQLDPTKNYKAVGLIGSSIYVIQDNIVGNVDNGATVFSTGKPFNGIQFICNSSDFTGDENYNITASK